VVHVDFGRVWRPNGVSRSWRPYSAGSWIWHSDDWYWKSDYPWGTTVFHYGQWFKDRSRGWLWVPGRTFAPAWVIWRHDQDWVGWAPKPPRWRQGHRHDLDYHDYLFVEQRYLGAPRLNLYLKWGENHRRLYESTRPRVHYRVPPASRWVDRHDRDSHRDREYFPHRRYEDRRDHQGDRRPPHDRQRERGESRPGLLPPQFPGESKPQPRKRPIAPHPIPGAGRPQQRNSSDRGREQRRDPGQERRKLAPPKVPGGSRTQQQREERKKQQQRERQRAEREKKRKAQEIMRRMQETTDESSEPPPNNEDGSQILMDRIRRSTDK
jgi:hypothetical protein